MPGTDVDHLFLDVLPRLARGTLIHIHDITLPNAYPSVWEWRGYNEQNAQLFIHGFSQSHLSWINQVTGELGPRDGTMAGYLTAAAWLACLLVYAWLSLHPSDHARVTDPRALPCFEQGSRGASRRSPWR